MDPGLTTMTEITFPDPNMSGVGAGAKAQVVARAVTVDRVVVQTGAGDGARAGIVDRVAVQIGAVVGAKAAVGARVDTAASPGPDPGERAEKGVVAGTAAILVLAAQALSLPRRFQSLMGA